MSQRLITNMDGATLAAALAAQLRGIEDAEGRTLSIATCFFNPEGLHLLGNSLDGIGHIRLLLGVEPEPAPLQAPRTPFDPEEPEYTRQRIQRALLALQQALRHDRDRLPFDLAQTQAIERLVAFLRSGQLEVRLYRERFLHAKAFILDGHGLIAGSANLTAAGMTSNLELGVGLQDTPIQATAEHWFERLWEQAEDFDLAAIYAEYLQEIPPWLIFMRVLYCLYGDEVLEEEAQSDEIGLTNFQKHGAWRAMRIIDRFGGAMISDGVGLGKTFTSGEIIKRYRERRQRVLLVRPAQLESTWTRFLNRHQLLVDQVSYEGLARDIQLGGESSHHLPNPIAEYALVVIDEAHAYRNPDAPSRAGVLRKVVSHRPDVLLLTATPVNNSLWDLYHLLTFFLRNDAALAEVGVPRLRDRFKEAMRVEPDSLNPDMLFPVIDATTVKRTRNFVRKHYADDLIPGPDGVMAPIQFPTPVARRVSYALDEAMPGFFDRFAEILMPAQGQPELRMARYQPERYSDAWDRRLPESALVGLLRSGLLKRFESSGYAFRRTLERMIEEHDSFLRLLGRGVVARKSVLQEVSAGMDSEDLQDVLDAWPESHESTEGFNVDDLEQDVEKDIGLLSEMRDRVLALKAADSPKMHALVEELACIVAEAEDEAIDEEDFRGKRKVLIFSTFAETIEWFRDELTRRMADDDRLLMYRGRVASVIGNHSQGGVSREEAAWGFAPRSTEAPPGREADRFDLLLTTDVLAEGVNLQEARHIINLDMPWNPMRLVQRHGRVDRINSPHDRVYLRTFFPDSGLDELLGLEERIVSKLAQAAAAIGLDDLPIEGGDLDTPDLVFSETRDEIKRLYNEDETIFERGGTKAAAQTGEEYRHALRQALNGPNGDLIPTLPFKMGSGLARGDTRGWVFCASVGWGERARYFLRFVPADDSLSIVSNMAHCLRLLECDPDETRVLPPEMARGAYDGWSRAQESVLDAWMFECDPANLQPKIPKANREAADFLRAHAPRDGDDSKMRRLIASVESPWPERAQKELRQSIRDESLSVADRLQRLIETIEASGIEPPVIPEPLPPISESDIALVCWMAIVPTQ